LPQGGRPDVSVIDRDGAAGKPCRDANPTSVDFHVLWPSRTQLESMI
jgi:hypothetical protein